MESNQSENVVEDKIIRINIAKKNVRVYNTVVKGEEDEKIEMDDEGSIDGLRDFALILRAFVRVKNYAIILFSKKFALDELFQIFSPVSCFHFFFFFFQNFSLYIIFIGHTAPIILQRLRILSAAGIDTLILIRRRTNL